MLPPDCACSGFLARTALRARSAGNAWQEDRHDQRAQRIQASWHYPPVHTFTAFKDGRDWSDKLRLVEATAKREITLPLYPGMRDEQVKLVVEALRDCLAQVSKVQ